MTMPAMTVRIAAATDAPTGEELIARARALAPVLAGREAETLARREVHPDTIADFRDAGFFRAVQAERWGGFKVPHAALAQVTLELAKGCPSSAWVFGVLATHSQFLSAFPEEAQQDVWGDNPSVLISSSLAPKPVEDVGNGLMLTGDWPFSSGSKHAGWVMLGTVSPVRGPLLALLPISEVTFLDDWHVMGLRGTGSNSVRLAGVFVPNHRLIAYPVIYAVDRHNPEYPLSFWDNHPLSMFGKYNFCSVAAGIAEKALAVAVDHLKANRGTPRAKADQETVQMRLAEAAADIEMASRLIIESCRELDSVWERGEPFTEALKLRQDRDICVLVWRMREAVEKLTSLNNAWIYDASPLQQLLRDIVVASAHRSANKEDSMLPYAQRIIAS
jgi:3-hydroxy-9,10-secoandrosta-1,3,5(10)-triene-9,17-dione monooxygenase